MPKSCPSVSTPICHISAGRAAPAHRLAPHAKQAHAAVVCAARQLPICEARSCPRPQAGLGSGMPCGRFTLKRSLAPGAALGGTSTVCAAPLGMRHMSLAPGLWWGGTVISMVIMSASTAAWLK